MNRKTLGALLIFLGLLGAAYLLLRRPPKGERTGERPRPIARIAPEVIKKLRISAKGKTVVLVRSEEDQWNLAEPLSYPADQRAARNVVDKIANLQFGDMVTELEGKHAELQVDQRTGIHVVASDGVRPLADFVLGREIDSFTMLRAAHKPQVFQAAGALRTIFERETKNWRERRIIAFQQDQLRQLQAATAGGSVAFSRPDEKTPWKVETSTTPIEPLDQGVLSSLIAALATLSAADFADGEKPETVGLRPPLGTLTAVLQDGQRIDLQLGNRKGEQGWAKRADGPQVFLINEYATLLKRPIDFRDKSVLRFNSDDVVALTVRKLADKRRLTLTKAAGGWIANGKKSAEEQKINTALAALSSLTAEAFAHHSQQELGLDRPAWEVRIELKDRTSHRLIIGSQEQDSGFGLMRSGMPEIFFVRKYTLDRFLLDPKDFN